jgi:hypothetical protein
MFCHGESYLKQSSVLVGGHHTLKKEALVSPAQFYHHSLSLPSWESFPLQSLQFSLIGPMTMPFKLILAGGSLFYLREWTLHIKQFSPTAELHLRRLGRHTGQAFSQQEVPRDHSLHSVINHSWLTWGLEDSWQDKKNTFPDFLYSIILLW